MERPRPDDVPNCCTHVSDHSLSSSFWCSKATCYNPDSSSIVGCGRGSVGRHHSLDVDSRCAVGENALMDDASGSADRLL